MEEGKVPEIITGTRWAVNPSIWSGTEFLSPWPKHEHAGFFAKKREICQETLKAIR